MNRPAPDTFRAYAVKRVALEDRRARRRRFFAALFLPFLLLALIAGAYIAAYCLPK
jgi:hypothetical protein